MNRLRTLDRDRVLVIVLAVITALVLITCAVVMAPFVPALTWALSLVVVAYPVHRWIAQRIRQRDIAAGVSVAVVAIRLIAPTAFIGYNVARQVADAASEFQTQAQSGKLKSMFDQYPLIGGISRWVQQHVDVDTESDRMLTGLRERLTRAVRNTIWSTAQIIIALFSLFFFFRDNGLLLRFLRSIVPLSEGETDEVFQQVTDMIYATIYGNFVTALIQGALGGLMFWILGIPAALLWGVVMAILSLVPSLGSFVIWLPAAAILGFQGQIGKSLILAAWGTLVVGTIDNLVYPMLVGKRMHMHTLAVFFATVGGLVVIGAPGIVLGPVAFTLALALLDVWRRRTSHGRKAEVPT